MTASLIIRRAGAGVTVQDTGRTGYLAQGLSRGGAADPLALAEGAALLDQPPSLAVLEISGSVVKLDATNPVWIALTGAPMRARTGNTKLRWNACHLLQPGQLLRLSPGDAGNFAYIHVAGGIETDMIAHGRGAHLAAGIGKSLSNGDVLPVGMDRQSDRTARKLPDADRFSGGDIRVLPGPQTQLFSPDERDRFLATIFTRTAWGNRQGVKLGHSGSGFRPEDGLHLISEVIVPGDIQITGDGTPYVLGVECQTIGGYARIGTVVPQDLPRVTQATPGSHLQFRFVTVPEALGDHRTLDTLTRELHSGTSPLVRDPRHIPDLLAYQLISGVTAGDDPADTEDAS